MAAEALVPAISVAVAMLIYGIGYFERRRLDKRQRTVAVLNSLYADSSMEQARTQVARMIFEGRRITSDGVSREEDRAIIQLLDFYEFVCRLIYSKDISAELVIELRGGAMRSAYRLLQGYIAERREHLGRPKLYQFVERFVNERVGSLVV